MKIYLISQCDADPYCGVHPIKAFSSKEDAEFCVNNAECPKDFEIQEIDLIEKE